MTRTEQAEVFPVDLKLDYKPRRVDYRALRDGKTIELMNFFHFDGAEMTLRHIVLTGVGSFIIQHVISAEDITDHGLDTVLRSSERSLDARRQSYSAGRCDIGCCAYKISRECWVRCR